MDNNFNEMIYSKSMPIDGVDKTRIDFILENIPDENLKVLDIGCWDGSYAIRYKKTTNTVYGIESSETSAKKAESKGIIVEHGNFVEENFFKGLQFDVVIAGEIIEHVFDTDLFLQKIRKMLVLNGKLIITTPNVASLPRRILLLFGINPMLENRVIVGESVGHIRYFTFDDMDKILVDNKFKIIQSKSDVLNLNNKGTLYSTWAPRIYKKVGRSVLICALKTV